MPFHQDFQTFGSEGFRVEVVALFDLGMQAHPSSGFTRSGCYLRGLLLYHAVMMATTFNAKFAITISRSGVVDVATFPH